MDKVIEQLSKSSENCVVSNRCWKKITNEIDYLAGETDELNEYDKIEGVEEHDYLIYSAENSWWKDKVRVDDIRTDETKEIFKAVYKPKDIAEYINERCDKGTHGLIKDIAVESDFEPYEDWCASLLNTIYIKEKWRRDLNINKRTVKFNNEDVDGILVDSHYIGYEKEDNGEWVSAPYENGFYFVAYVPNDINEVDVEKMLNHNKSFDKVYGLVKMPVIDIEGEVNEKRVIVTNTVLKTIITRQKSKFKCDENGVEAAAATYATLGLRCASLQIPKEITLDKPFYFFVIKNNETIFAGKKIK